MTEKMKLEKVFQVVELKQVQCKTNYTVQQIKSPSDAAAILIDLIGQSDREKFVVMMLNTKNEVIGIDIAHVGSINASIVHPREVFKSAIMNNATSVLVGHNHPSNNCQYSPEDLEVSRRLEEAGLILGIELIDSIIVGADNYLSLREENIL